MPIDAEYINEFRSTQDHLSRSRVNRVRSGDQEYFQLTAEGWLGHQDILTEKITYASLSTSHLIKEIEYAGETRYQDDKPQEEGFRITLHLRNFDSLARLARLLEYSRFKEIGCLDTIRAYSDGALLRVNFSEALVKDNEDYLDEFFQLISQIETLPLSLLADLKGVIAYNCVELFKRKLELEGFLNALRIIRTTALKGMYSPFYVAALHCKSIGKFKEARKLIQQISKHHQTYDTARTLERSIYEEEIKHLNTELDQVKSQRVKLKQLENTVEPIAKPVLSPSIDYQKRPIIQPTALLNRPLTIQPTNLTNPITFSQHASLKQGQKREAFSASSTLMLLEKKSKKMWQ